MRRRTPVSGQGSGTLTWLPSPGRVIRQGQVLYRTDNGDPVVLLYGPVPAWRSLYEGLTGADVAQLNHDLVALGYAAARISARWAGITTRGRPRTGCSGWSRRWASPTRRGRCRWGRWYSSRRRCGSARCPGSLGSPASGPVLSATSDRHVVTISLDAAQKVGGQGRGRGDGHAAERGHHAGRDLLGGHRGIRVGQLAHDPGVRHAHAPVGGRTLDQAPVTVEITTARRDALVVPVAALLAQPAGGYAVEVVAARGAAAPGAGDPRDLR